MAEEDMKTKVQSALRQGVDISEEQVRSTMILVRKLLERMDDVNRLHYLNLNLFCNWCAHIEISQSNTGLRILAQVNDALVRVKNVKEIEHIRSEISDALGFRTLHTELINFLNTMGIGHELDKTEKWSVFLEHIIEIIRDVPLMFPPLDKLSKSAQKIYNQIANNPIKPGAGVINVSISKINYEALFPNGNVNEIDCLLVRAEDTTITVVPLLINT